mmetsp:Transcript_105019/g.254960  ORF Transcript_105019/g.254960 Transcript_105019/m.254960 type:complete len:229 (+) Transcript_105019:793-1479(+)
MTTAPMRDTLNKLCSASSAFSSGEPTAANTVGNAQVMQAKSCNPMLTSAPFTEKSCSFSATMQCLSLWYSSSCMMWCGPCWWLLGERPPRKKAVPRTSRRFERIEPSNEDLTIPKRPFRSVCTVRIISTALPSVAFSRPLSVSLWMAAASSSVVSPRNLARGMMPRMLSQKVQAMPHPRNPEQMPRGRHKSRKENGCTKMDFSPWILSGPCNVDTLPSLPASGSFIWE